MEKRPAGTNEETNLKELYTKNKTVIHIIAAILALAVAYSIYQWATTHNTANSSSEATPTATALIAGTQDTNTPAPQDTTATPTASEVPQLSPGDNPQAPTPTADWEPVAQGFGEAWANTDGGRDAWLERLRPYVNDTTYQGFEYTDFERYITDKQVDHTQLAGIDGYDRRVEIYYTDDPTTPAVTVILSPTGENLQYQVVSVQ